jgi:hypothetical protein
MDVSPFQAIPVRLLRSGCRQFWISSDFLVPTRPHRLLLPHLPHTTFRLPDHPEVAHSFAECIVYLLLLRLILSSAVPSLYVRLLTYLCGFIFSSTTLFSHLWLRPDFCGFTLTSAVLTSHLRLHPDI